MTETIHRLEDRAPELYSLLIGATAAELRNITLSVCEFAIRRSETSFPLMEEVIQRLQNKEPVGSQFRIDIERLAFSLDEKYLSSEDVDEGAVYDAAADRFFAQARAASAVSYGLSEDPFVAAAESVYEALAATDDVEDISRIVKSIIRNVQGEAG